MQPLRTMYAASNPMTSNWPSRESSSSLFMKMFSKHFETLWYMTWFYSFFFLCSVWIWIFHHLSSGVIPGGHIDCGYLLLAGLIPNVQCSSSEPVVSWKQSASLLQVSHPGTDAALTPIPIDSFVLCAQKDFFKIANLWMNNTSLPQYSRLSAALMRFDLMFLSFIVTQVVHKWLAFSL